MHGRKPGREASAQRASALCYRPVEATERHAATVRKLSDEHRLGNGELDRQRRLLGHKVDAPLASGVRQGQNERLAVELERAAGWRKQTAQYPEERRPPRSILAEDRVDATGRSLQSAPSSAGTIA